ncbi:MAG: RHS repeat-associated core domain-containing protein [Chloroflexi bacterium]|nr:RHS repeat-associated core domain-containing protein [Chloroflexota bacterium]
MRAPSVPTTLTWDIQNRLTAVTGGVSYVYDGDGFRVKKIENGVTIFYASKYYQKNLSTGVPTFYYYLGDELVAYRESWTLRYVHQDHLTGTSLTTDTSATVVGSIKYKPYGETRSSSGTLPAQKFTGQRLDDIGLYYYGARYYDPGLGRFISADSIVPGSPAGNSVVTALMVDLTTGIIAGLKKAPSRPQSLNRYSYVLNNPLRYVDPTGRKEVTEEDDDENLKPPPPPAPDEPDGDDGTPPTASDPKQPQPAQTNSPASSKTPESLNPLTRTNDKVVRENVPQPGSAGASKEIGTFTEIVDVVAIVGDLMSFAVFVPHAAIAGYLISATASGAGLVDTAINHYQGEVTAQDLKISVATFVIGLVPWVGTAAAGYQYAYDKGWVEAPNWEWLK